MLPQFVVHIYLFIYFFCTKARSGSNIKKICIFPSYFPFDLIPLGALAQKTDYKTAATPKAGFTQHFLRIFWYVECAFHTPKYGTTPIVFNRNTCRSSRRHLQHVFLLIPYPHHVKKHMRLSLFVFFCVYSVFCVLKCRKILMKKKLKYASEMQGCPSDF